MSVGDDVVAPRCAQVPKCDRAITTGQRSAAQNGQDSSLMNTIPAFPSMRRAGPELTGLSGVTGSPAPIWDSTVGASPVTWATTLAGAAASLAAVPPETKLVVTRTATTASTTPADARGTSSRRRTAPC